MVGPTKSLSFDTNRALSRRKFVANDTKQPSNIGAGRDSSFSPLRLTVRSLQRSALEHDAVLADDEATLAAQGAESTAHRDPAPPPPPPPPPPRGAAHT